MKTRWIVLVMVMVALVGVGAAIAPAVWHRITVKRVWRIEADISLADKWKVLRGPIIFYLDYDRQSPGDFRWKARGWYASSGMMAMEIVSASPPSAWIPYYEPDGTVAAVDDDGDPDDIPHRSPPWPLSITDQTEPTAPWIAQGITAAEFWEQVKAPGEPTLEEFVAEHQGEPK